MRKPVISSNLVLCFLLFFSSTSYGAGGAGDGTISSSWMSDERMLKALEALRKRQFTAAANVLKTLVTDKPDFADAWNYLGFSLRKLNQSDESLKAYQTALKLDPKHRGAHAYLGQLYLQTGKLQKAEELRDNLKNICRYGCPELEELEQALSKYNKPESNGSQY